MFLQTIPEVSIVKFFYLNAFYFHEFWPQHFISGPVCDPMKGYVGTMKKYVKNNMKKYVENELPPRLWDSEKFQALPLYRLWD